MLYLLFLYLKSLNCNRLYCRPYNGKFYFVALIDDTKENITCILQGLDSNHKCRKRVVFNKDFRTSNYRHVIDSRLLSGFLEGSEKSDIYTCEVKIDFIKRYRVIYYQDIEKGFYYSRVFVFYKDRTDADLIFRYKNKLKKLVLITGLDYKSMTIKKDNSESLTANDGLDENITKLDINNNVSNTTSNTGDIIDESFKADTFANLIHAKADVHLKHKNDELSLKEKDFDSKEKDFDSKEKDFDSKEKDFDSKEKDDTNSYFSIAHIIEKSLSESDEGKTGNFDKESPLLWIIISVAAFIFALFLFSKHFFKR